MLKHIHIRWIWVSYSNVSEMEDTYFYLFAHQRTLKYIGKAYYQEVKKEIDANLHAFGLSKQKTDIWLGYIVKSDYARITDEIVRDVEALLIIAHKPYHNTQNASNYFGRDNLAIRNTGFGLLKSVVTIQNNYIYAGRESKMTKDTTISESRIKRHRIKASVQKIPTLSARLAKVNPILAQNFKKLRPRILRLGSGIQEKLTPYYVCYYGHGKGFAWFELVGNRMRVTLRKGKYFDRKRKLRPGRSNLPHLLLKPEEMDIKYLMQLILQAYRN